MIWFMRVGRWLTSWALSKRLRMRASSRASFRSGHPRARYWHYSMRCALSLSDRHSAGRRVCRRGARDGQHQISPANESSMKSSSDVTARWKMFPRLSQPALPPIATRISPLENPLLKHGLLIGDWGPGGGFCNRRKSSGTPLSAAIAISMRNRARSFRDWSTSRKYGQSWFDACTSEGPRGER